MNKDKKLQTCSEKQKRANKFGKKKIVSDKQQGKASKLSKTFQDAKTETKQTSSNSRKENPLLKAKRLEAKNRYIIIHYSKWKVKWNWMVLAFTFYTAVVVPLVLTFPTGKKGIAWLLFHSAIDLFFLCDLVFSFHTTYVGKEGKMVTNLRKIRINYATKWFLIDLLSCLPYETMTMIVGVDYEEEYHYFPAMLTSLKFLRVFRIGRDADRLLEHLWGTLVMLLCLLLLACHWMACGWYTVSLIGVSHYLEAEQKLTEFQNSKESLFVEEKSPFVISNEFTSLKDAVVTWEESEIESDRFSNKVFDVEKNKPDVIENNDHATVLLPPMNWLLRLAKTTKTNFDWNRTTGELTGGPGAGTSYVASLYFTITTVTSVGFGNIAGDTFEEQIFCSFILLIGSLLFAAIVGNVTIIIEKIASQNQILFDQLKEIQYFAKVHQLPPKLVDKIFDYVSYTAETHGINDNTVLNLLPDHMQAEVCLIIHRNVIKSQKVFRFIDQNGVYILANRLQRFCIAPSDIVCDRGEEVDAIYFVISGSLEVLQEDKVVAILHKGDSFGAYLWKSDLDLVQSEVVVKALTYASLDFIKGKTLTSAMDMFPSIDWAFKKRFRLTYDLCYIFAIRTMESVRWEKEAAENPAVAEKVERLKRWIHKTNDRKKKNPPIITISEDEDKSTQETQKMTGDTKACTSKLVSWKDHCSAIFARALLGLRFVFRKNKISEMEGSFSKVSSSVAIKKRKSDHKISLKQKKATGYNCKRCGISMCKDFSKKTTLEKASSSSKQRHQDFQNLNRIRLVPMMINSDYVALLSKNKNLLLTERGVEAADGLIETAAKPRLVPKVMFEVDGNNSSREMADEHHRLVETDTISRDRCINSDISENDDTNHERDRQLLGGNRRVKQDVTSRKLVKIKEEEKNQSGPSDRIAKMKTPRPLKEKVNIKCKDPQNVLENSSSINTDKISPNKNTIISATCYKRTVDSCGKQELILVGEIYFSLESKLWMDLELPPEIKETLQSFLDFKLNISRSLVELERKLARSEALLRDINTLVGQKINFQK